MDDMTDLMIYRNFVETKISPNVTDTNMMGWALLGLGAEVGEVQGLAEKSLRKNEAIDMDKLISELGDVMFFWMAAVIAAGLDPDEIMEYNISKLNQRESEGTLIDSSGASDKS